MPTCRTFALAAVVATALVTCVAACSGGGSAAAAAQWRLASPPRAADTVLALLVTETECASGRTAEGRIVPEVEYTETAVRVSVSVRPIGGDQDCPSNPETPYELRLTEPVGDRVVEAVPSG